MCKIDGTPKIFQTRLKELAIIKAKKQTANSKLTYREYFCIYCRYWCITSQPYRKTKNPTNVTKRFKKKMRPQICEWENEGGSFRE